MDKILTVIEKQRNFFLTNKSKPIDFRREQLLKFRKLLMDHEEELLHAVYQDLGKNEFDAFISETGILYQEIKLTLKNLKKWMKPGRVRTNLINLPGRSRIYPEPLGNTLIISTWNYPVYITLSPVVPALAAGNTIILKPSEITPHTSGLIAKILNQHFPEEVLYVTEGGIDVNSFLLGQRFDKIFFTGSTRVGKIVMEAASKYLTPVTLELGGKSPCFVLEDANLTIAARRIVWGKYLNAGQTCIAPDFLIVHRSIHDKLIQCLKDEILKNYGPVFSENKAYMRIVNESHFNRLVSIIDQEKLVFGGEHSVDNLYIAPAILDYVTFEDECMKDEIFGPILPVIVYDQLENVISKLKTLPKPLSCYVFTSGKKQAGKIINELSFGGGAVNDTVMHISNPFLPFGGVGLSGMGKYHGGAGFSEFSNYKSILFKSNYLEPKLKYPPYSSNKLRIIKFFLK